ncbi:MAG: hypothetical protein R3F53_08085 [Gammaproteobacteria bacterium]
MALLRRIKSFSVAVPEESHAVLPCNLFATADIHNNLGLAGIGRGQVLAQTRAQDLPPLPDEKPNSPKGISLWQPGDPGQRLFIDGSVLTPDGQGIAGAVLSVRQADANGVYHPDRYPGGSDH